MNQFYITNKKALLEVARETYLPQFREVYEKEGLDELISSIYDLSDYLFDKSGLFKGKATCNKSCSFCCHDKISMSNLEAKYIESKIKLNNLIPNQERKTLQQNNPSESLKFMDRACPMLSDANENGERACSIYEHRPLICRTHNSLEPVEFCDKEKYPNRTIQEGRMLMTEALHFGLYLLEKELGLTGEIPQLVMMHDL